MSFLLHMTYGPFAFPEYTFQTDNVLGAIGQVRQDIRQGYSKRMETSAFSQQPFPIYLKIGPGSLLRLTRDTHIAEIKADMQRRTHNMQQGLIAPAPLRTKSFCLILQDGNAQMEPELEFDSLEDAEHAVEEALVHGFLEHEIEQDNDYLFFIPRAGHILMALSKEDAEARRRMIVEMNMRAAQQRAQGAQKPRIIT